MNDTEWNEYLKKYKEKYILFKAEDGIWQIECYRGNFIMLYSLSEGELGFFFRISGKMKPITLLKEMEVLGIKGKIAQKGDSEVLITFPESKIGELENLLKIKKRPSISAEVREKRRQSMLELRKSGKAI